MNREIRDRWVQALRSGEFTQGKRQLRRVSEKGVEYCCLGVLCYLHGQETGVKFGQDDSYMGVPGVPPSVVGEWAGLPETNPKVRPITIPGRLYYEDVTTLAGLNDEGATFEEIATMIEQNF